MKKVTGDFKIKIAQAWLTSFFLRSVALTILLSLINNCHAQLINLKEDFSDNHRKWEEGLDNHESSIVKDGVYKINSFDNDRWYWFSIPISIQNDKDWVLNADFHIDSFQNNKAFCGIVWGAKNAENMLQFSFYPNYKYAEGHVLQKKEYKTLFPKNSLPIDDSLNIHFTLVHSEGSYWYIINGKAIDKTSENPFFGNKFGFLIGSKIQVSVDNFEIQELELNSPTLANYKKYFALLLDEHGNIARKWGFYFNQANELLKKGDTTESILMIDRADSSARKEFYSKDTLEYWRLRNPIASFLIDAGELSKAQYILEKCLNVFENADSTKSTMYPVLLANIGRCSSRMGNYRDAIRFYRKALEIRKKIFGWQDQRTINTAEYIIGVNIKMGETGNSISVYQEILNGIKSEVGDICENYFLVSDQYALLLLSLGKTDLALKQMEQTLYGREKFYIDTPYHLIPSLHFIGKTYLEIENLDSAEKYFFQSNKLAVKYKVYNWIPQTEIGLAEVYRLKGEYHKAEKILLKYYKINQNKNDFQLNNNLGSFYYDRGEYKSALKHFLICKTVSDKWSLPYYLQSRKELLILYSHLCKTYFTLNHYVNAIRYGTLCQNLVFYDLNGNKDILTESDYFSFLKVYHDQINWYNFISSLGVVNQFDDSTLEISKNLFRFNELFHFSKKISEHNEYLKELIHNNEKIDFYLDSLSYLLRKKNAVYISIIKFPLFIEAGYGYLALIKTKSRRNPITVRLDIKNSLDSIFSNEQRKIIDKQKIDTAIKNIFLDRLWPFISGEKLIYFSADGIFNKCNLETIQLFDSANRRNYLGDLSQIRLINGSYEIFTDSLSSVSSINNVTLFGYPDYNFNLKEHISQSVKNSIDTISSVALGSLNSETGSYSFKPLIATKHEVEEISLLLKAKGWLANTYLGRDATEEQIKKIRNPRVLHIATHGFFAEDIQPESRFMGIESSELMDNPMLRSGLAFSRAENTRTDTFHGMPKYGDDGILTAEEAQFLHLDSTELVVLSACETGLGTVVNGEGIYGLQRAFRAAGARNILVSLWKVDDLATETLMKSFYRHWLDDGMNKHDALWQAKLDLRHDKDHPDWAKPYYWGAFVLIGE